MTTTLEQAKAALRRSAAEAVKSDVVEVAGVADPSPTGDPALDAERQRAINALGRPLSPEESFNVAEGRPHDFTPPPPPLAEIDPEATLPDEVPEDAFRRIAAMRAEKGHA